MHFTSEMQEIMAAYQSCRDIEAKVEALDPLGADDFFKQLPTFNNREDYKGILNGFIPLLQKKREGLSQLSMEEAMAAVRDCGMVASSLVRLGISVPEVIEYTLLELSKRTGEVPADTVYSYGPRNPTGCRQRTYTGYGQERAFIGSFSYAVAELYSAAAKIEMSQLLPVFSDQYISLMYAVYGHISNVTATMVKVKKLVTPDFFTNHMRPFFEPKTIGNRRYFAPGGAQMPLVLIDLALWGAECTESWYVRYWGENIAYMPNVLISRARGIVNNNSLLIKAQELEDENKPSLPEAQQGIQATISVFLAIKKFRFPHLKVAEENMAIRPKGALGSGGYDADILYQLIDKIEGGISKLEAAKKE